MIELTQRCSNAAICIVPNNPKPPSLLPSMLTRLLACRRWENWMAARKRKGMAFFHLLLETRWSLLHVLLARSLTWPDLVVFWKERSLTRPSPFCKYEVCTSREMMIDGAAAAAAAVVAGVGCISKDLPIKYVFLFRSWKIPLISKKKKTKSSFNSVKWSNSCKVIFYSSFFFFFLFVSLAFRQFEARLYEENSDQ